ncbi:hypothetical protein SDC9_201713 [bioreactor metagenome]|uniref:Uncharacterized protein n=1 Tax=bioreactor metagenome TaxID=1076179 RepID=A0A645J0K9_9ZZZZ
MLHFGHSVAPKPLLYLRAHVRHKAALELKILIVLDIQLVQSLSLIIRHVALINEYRLVPQSDVHQHDPLNLNKYLDQYQQVHHS